MRERGVRIEALVLHLIKAVNTIGEHLLIYIGEVVAGHYGFKFAAQLIGERAALGEELKAHVGHMALLELEIYYEIILVGHNCISL